MKVIYTHLSTSGDLITFKYNGSTTISIWNDDEYIALITCPRASKKSAMEEVMRWIGSEQYRVLVGN